MGATVFARRDCVNAAITQRAALGNRPSTGWNSDELEEHIRDENSTFTWLLEPMIEHCGFEIVQAEYSDDRFYAAYVLRATPDSKR